MSYNETTSSKVRCTVRSGVPNWTRTRFDKWAWSVGQQGFPDTYMCVVGHQDPSTTLSQSQRVRVPVRLLDGARTLVGGACGHLEPSQDVGSHTGSVGHPTRPRVRQTKRLQVTLGLRAIAIPYVCH